MTGDMQPRHVDLSTLYVLPPGRFMNGIDPLQKNQHPNLFR
jgi:hypothetical protein